MINNLINWKKNIKPIHWEGLNVYFDTKLEYREIVQKIKDIIILHQPMQLIGELRNDRWNTENTEFALRKTLQSESSDSDISVLKEIISVSYLKKSFFVEEDKYIFQIHSENLEENFITEILSLQGMKIAIRFNPYFKLWENRKFKDMYFYKGGLKEKYDDKLGVKSISLVDRPGRYTKCIGFNFLGGSEYWFMKGIISQSKLNLLEDSEVNSIVSNTVVHIKLFDLPDYWSKSSQKKLSQIRKILEVDK